MRIPVRACFPAILSLCTLLVVQTANAQRNIPEDDRELLHEIYKELIEYKTTVEEENNTIAAEGMAAWLQAAGFPAEDIFIGGALPHKGNVVARYRGTGVKEPIVMMAHLDVVTAERDDWNLDPFVLNEDEDYYYGRGTIDDKAMGAIFIANLIRFKREGYVPDRDFIVALTSDEESGGSNGVGWLLENQPGLIQGALAINEGGYGLLQDGQPLANTIQIAEKIYATFRVTAKNPGGHSSLPRDDNAIYDLAEALLRIRDFKFPVELNDVMRVSFERQAEINTGQRAADFRALLESPIPQDSLDRLSAEAAINAQLRTTAVATLLDGGHAPNALPQTAVANVNVRMLPGSDPQEVLETLIAVVDNPGAAGGIPRRWFAHRPFSLVRGDHGGGGDRHRGDVARGHRDANHVDRRYRWRAHAPSGHSHLWHIGPVRRSQRYAHPRAGRDDCLKNRCMADTIICIAWRRSLATSNMETKGVGGIYF